MFNNQWFENQILPEREKAGIFGFSFLSWQGNAISYQDSLWMVYVIYALLIIGTLLIYIFKDEIRKNYYYNTKSVTTIFQVIGIMICCMSIFRIIILSVGNYPNLWELIPFHFCRMFVILIGISLIFKKLNMIKYFGMFAIGGGIVGLLISDLGNSEYWSQFGGMDIGVDNYIFWDFFIIHSSSVMISIYLFTAVKPKIYKSTMAYTMLSMAFFTITIFLLNMFLSKLPNPKWRPNWFYLGVPELNGIDDMLKPYIGVLANYPMILGTFMVIGIILYTSLTMIYLNSDHLKFILKDNVTGARMFKIKLVASDNMFYFSEGPLKYRNNYHL